MICNVSDLKTQHAAKFSCFTVPAGLYLLTGISFTCHDDIEPEMNNLQLALKEARRNLNEYPKYQPRTKYQCLGREKMNILINGHKK